GPIAMPPAQNPSQPNITWYIGVSFSTPLTVPDNGRPLFYGVGLPPAPGNSYPNDGLSVLVVSDSTAYPQHDVPGRAAGAIPNGSQTCWMLTSNGLPSSPCSYVGAPGQRQLMFCDLAGIGAGGTPLAQTNQTNYWISNPGPWG